MPGFGVKRNSCRYSEPIWCRRAVVSRCAPTSPSLRHPVIQSATAWAPATVANIGPGFDWMGCAVDGEGDTVTATVDAEKPPGTITIASIEGDGGRLSIVADENCVGIAARETLALLPNPPSCAISLTLQKGLPLGSGMGSSAASAAAACWAVNNLFDNVLTKEQLVFAGLQSEAYVSGYHADNIAAAVLGGFVLIRSAKPLDMQCLDFPGDMFFVLVNPKFEAPTREMRAALPETVPFKSLIHNSVAGGSLVAAILTGDVPQLGKALGDEIIVEAARGPLIPGFAAVKAAATEAGAFGCTISGAGPTIVAVVDDEQVGMKVGEAMSRAFLEHGKLETNSIQIARLDQRGARTIAQ